MKVEAHLPPPPPWTPESQQAAEMAAQKSLALLGEHVPEAIGAADRITQGAATLIEQHKVRPEFFDEPDRATIFLSLALGTNTLQDERDPTIIQERQQFIANATTLLVRHHSAVEYTLPEDVTDASAVYAAFEQPEVSERLTDYIQQHSYLLEGARRRLRLRQEASFDVHALSIGTNAGSAVFASEANGLTAEEIEAWDAGLARRTADFSQRLPDGAGFAAAAAFTNVKTKGIYIPLVIAEQLLAQQDGIHLANGAGSELYHIISHEFVHTQGDVMVEGVFGSMLEEHRAKYFSGDHVSYMKDMRLFRALEGVYGASVSQMFSALVTSEANERPASLYELIGREYGIESIAELAAVYPQEDARNATVPEVRAMLQALGGHRKIVERIAGRTHGREAAAHIGAKFFRTVGILGLHRHLQHLQSKGA